MIFGLGTVTFALIVLFVLVVFGVYLFLRRTTTAYREGKSRR